MSHDLAAVRTIADWLVRHAGLSLDPRRGYLFESRLRPVLLRFGVDGLSDLARMLVRGGAPALADAVVEALATHETSFFRDRAVFDRLEQTLLPELAAARAGRILRLWSAAAATGQEVWTLAIVCRRAAIVPPAAGWEIVASDIAAESLQRAEEGVYSHFEVQRGLRARELAEWFRRTPRGFEVCDELRRKVRFLRHNLLDPPDRLGGFDAVLLRNALIYMSDGVRRRVLDNVLRVLAPDGVLVLGASEVLLDRTDLEPIAGAPGLFRPARVGASATGLRQPT